MKKRKLAERSLIVIVVLCAVTLQLDAQKEKVYLLAMAPFPNDDEPNLDPLYSGGHSLIPGAELAMEHINNDPSLLANRTLELLVGSSGCDKTSVTVTTLLGDVVESDVPIMGVLGPACSESALSLAALTADSRLGVIQLMTGTSPLLNDHSSYPYTFGMVSSSLIYVDIIMELIRLNNWEKFAILYDDHREYFIRTHLELLDRTSIDNITFVGGMYDEYIPLDEIKSAMDTRIVIVLSSNGLAKRMLCLAGHLPFNYPVYQFVFIDRSVSSLIGDKDFEFSYDGVDLKCTIELMERALHNSVLLRFALDSLPKDIITVSGYSVGEIQEQYSEKIEEVFAAMNSTPQRDIYAYPYYDATWALAKVLDATLPQIESDLPQRSYIAGNHSRIIREAMYGVNFQGSSVTVQFDRKNGHVTSNVDIFQALYQTPTELVMRKIGQWSNGTITIFTEPSDENFIESAFEKSFVSVHLALAVFSLLFTLLTLVATLTLQLVNIVYQSSRVIKADSPRMNHFIFAGCYCLILAVVLYTKITAFPSTSLDPAARLVGTIFCNTMLFASVLGYTLIAGTICAKSWRLYRIFSHSFQANNFLSDKPLAAIVIVLALLDFVILIPWVSIDVGPFEEVALRRIIPATDGEMPYERIQYSCEPQEGNYIAFPLVLIVYQGLLTGVVLALSISNRNIKQKEFRSTKRINTLVYILAIQIVLGGSVYVILSVLVHASLDLQHFFFVFTLLFAVLLCLVFLFVPQVFDLMQSRSKRIERFASVVMSRKSSLHESLIFPRKGSCTHTV